MTRLPQIVSAFLVLLAPLAAWATTATVSEPGSWALVAIGLVAAAIVKIRNGRK